MQRALIIFIALFTLGATGAFADKPTWAGEGGKPTDAQIEQHREEMRNKNQGKDKGNKDDSLADLDKDKDKNKDKKEK
jgi:hypothetical protein